MSSTIQMLAPVIIFFVILLAMGFYVQKKSADARAENYSKDYFIGGRSLGGFVLAMTLVATYGSVSSFLSGPGVAWEKGFGWVYYASTGCCSLSCSCCFWQKNGRCRKKNRLCYGC